MEKLHKRISQLRKPGRLSFPRELDLEKITVTNDDDDDDTPKKQSEDMSASSPMCLSPTSTSHSSTSCLSPTSTDRPSTESGLVSEESNGISPRAVDDGTAYILYKESHAFNYLKEPLIAENVTFCFKCEGEDVVARNEYIVVTGRKYSRREERYLLIYRQIFVCEPCGKLIQESLYEDPYALISICQNARLLYKAFRL